MRRFRRRVTSGKVAIKHSSTLVDNTGAGVGSIFGHVIFKTNVGARLVSGNVQSLQAQITTENTCQVSDVVKYVNICLECCPREPAPASENELDNCSWLEWAVCWQREQEVTPGVANIGVATLGTICSHVFRENCFMTGCFPIGTKQAMSQDIRIKIPQRCCRLKMGDTLTIFCYVRTSDSTDTRTNSHRLIASSHFKGYS